jgi:hypothetical protein
MAVPHIAAGVALERNDDPGNGLGMRLNNVFPANLPRLRRGRFNAVVEIVVVEKVVYLERACPGAGRAAGERRSCSK